MSRAKMSNVTSMPKRRAVIIGIMILIAAAHILGPGRYAQGALYNFYYSYFSDLVMPFGFYFLLCLDEQWVSLLRRWQVKLAIMFLLPSLAETCQYFGIPVLGSTFDPLDYGMYAIGVASAAIVDRQVFSRIFRFWTIEEGR